MRVIKIPTDALIKTVLFQLENGGKANLTVTGSSMLPMLREHFDAVVLSPANRELAPGEIGLYRKENGEYILHRVIRTEKNSYLFCGDNQFRGETVAKDQVLAVVTEFSKKGTPHKLTEFGYRVYTMLWVKLFKVRKYYIGLRRWLGRIRRRNKERI